MRNPTEVADLERPNGIGFTTILRRTSFEQALDALHRRQQQGALFRHQRSDHFDYLLSGGPIERIKYGTAPLRQLQPALARIDRRACSFDVAPARKFFYQAAHVTEIEPKLARNLRRRGLLA